MVLSYDKRSLCLVEAYRKSIVNQNFFIYLIMNKYINMGERWYAK